MTYEEIILLRDNLLKDLISCEDAKKLYYKEKNRSWYTKDWKERRNAIIKDKCEQCGSTETLTLQHFLHPQKYLDIQRLVFQKYYEKYLDENSSELNSLVSKDDILTYIKNAPHKIKMVCPICSGNFYTRRKSPIHVCSRCKYEFDEPVSKDVPEYVDDLVLTEKEKQEIRNLKKSSVKFYTDLYPSIIGTMVRNKYLNEIDKMTMLNYLDENIEYLSFKNTKTFCKKCAFNFDKMGRDLCPKCKENYKQIKYEYCVDCLPEGDKKKEIQERQADYKKMKEYFKYLDEIE